MLNNRLEKLAARRIDPSILTAKKLNEVYNRISQSDSVRYVIGSMQSIDPEYTKNTYAQGERVRNQLEKQLEDKCEFEYQGSVTNDTHIRARSDIDLLVITGKYYSLEPPQKPGSPYKGDPIQDLISLRTSSASILKSAFPEAKVNTSGSKSIDIEGGSLTRKIDIVPSNWWNTNKYTETGDKIYRGVEILDFENKKKIGNTPFLHNAWIEYKDVNTYGGLRKAARLMKSLKYDTEQIELSSYDIVSIAFNIPNDKLTIQNGMELSILDACYNFCNQLLQDSSFRESIEVPDQHRKIFSDGHATKLGLNQMVNALSELVRDVLEENSRSFRKLAEARVEY